jgi:hypothetical protein
MLSKTTFHLTFDYLKKGGVIILEKNIQKKFFGVGDVSVCGFGEGGHSHKKYSHRKYK